MNTKMLVTQFGLLPESAMRRNINSVLYPVRRAMLTESVKETPNVDLVRSCKELDYILKSFAPEIVHDLDSTAAFVFKTDDDARTPKERADAAKRTLIRLVAEGRESKPRSKAELDAKIALMLQQEDDARFEGIGKAADALAYIDGITFIPPNEDFAETTISEAMGKAKARKAKKASSTKAGTPEADSGYNEDSLPEWLVEAISDKMITAGENTLRDSLRRLEKARYPHQRVGPEAERAAAIMFLKHFGITEGMVVDRFANAESLLQSDFDRMLAEDENLETSLDNPPADNTVTGKKERYRVEKARAQGITSADMGAAAGVK